MSSFTDYLEDVVLNHIFRNVAYTPVATVYMGLFTVAPTDAGGGTELSGNGYSRQAVAFGASSGGVIQNTGLISFQASGGNWGTVLAGAIFDSATAGNMLSWDTFTGVVINDGDTLEFAVNNISISLT